MYVDLMTVA